MHLFLGILFAFIALLFGSPLLALLLGITFTLFFASHKTLINKTIGTKLLQIGIVILGLTISASNVIYMTSTYFAYISIFVILVFISGILISKILRIDSKLSILIASGTAMSYGEGSVETATVLKLARTLWLIPLIIILGIFYKDSSSKNTLPLFVFAFILAVLLGTQLNFSNQMILALENISSAFLVGALFCIGAQIDKKSIKEIDTKTAVLALLLWLFAIMISYYFTNLI